MVAMFQYTLAAYRLYDDDGGEAASTALELQDTAHSLTVTADTSIQIRVRLDETGGDDGSTMDDYQLEYNKNSTGFTAVPTSDGGDGISAGTAGLTNDDPTTNRATDGISDGGGTFVAGEQSTDGLIDDHQLTNGNFTEHVYGVTFFSANVADTDTFEFTVTGPSKAADSVTPTVNIVVPLAGGPRRTNIISTNKRTSPVG